MSDSDRYDDLMVLDEAVSQLRTWFDDESGKLRFIALLSPT